MRTSRGALLLAVALVVAGSVYLLTRDRAARVEGVTQAESAHPATETSETPAREAVEASPRAAAETIPAQSPIESQREEADAQALEILVVDPEGKSVAGAKLFLFRNDALLAQGTTDVGGLTRFHDLEGRAQYAISASGWEFVRGVVDLARGRRTLTLSEGARVGGIVVVDGAPPVEPFEVRWELNSRLKDQGLPQAIISALRNPASQSISGTALTNADGHFEIRGVHPDLSGALAWSGRFFLLEQEGKPRAQRLQVEEPRRDIVLQLVEGCELRLRVVDVLGAPLAGANITLKRAFQGGDSNSASSSSAIADPDGRYRTSFFHPGGATFIVSVAPPGSSAAKTYALTAPVLRGVWDVGDLATLPTRAIRVLVQNAEGQPIAGASVHAWPSELTPSRLKTDAQGIISVSVGAETPTIAAQAFEYESTLVAVPHDASELTATLQRACLLEFEFVPANAKLEGLSVEVSGPTPMFADQQQEMPASRTPDRPPTPRVESGSLDSTSRPDSTVVRLRPTLNQRLRLAGLAAHLPLKAKLIGGGKTLCSVEIPALDPGEQRRVPLAILQTAKSLVLRVLSPSGEPVNEATIDTRLGSAGSSTSSVDDDGELRLGPLFGEQCVFVVRSEHFAPKRVVLRPIPEGRCDVVLEEAHSLAVELVQTDGAPCLAEAKFDAQIGINCGLLETSLGAGRFQLDGLPAGDVLIGARGSFGSIVRLHRAGEPVLRFVVGETGSIQVTVAGVPEGEEAGWMIAAAAAGAPHDLTRAALVRWMEGACRSSFDGLAQGTYELRFVHLDDPEAGARFGAPVSVVIHAKNPNVQVTMKLLR